MTPLDIGDLVKIKKKLPSCMSHFTANKRAIITEEGDQEDYEIFIEGEGEAAWYPRDTLTLVKRGQGRLLRKWKADLENLSENQGKLDWIFKNGPANAKNLPGASFQVLREMTGIGYSGPFEYAIVGCFILKLAAPFLKKKDKKGWITFVEEHKKTGYTKEMESFLEAQKATA
jgi:hypothetical protein